MSNTISTIDEQEIKKFADMANEWWDENGKFKPLHLMNPIRISYIRNQILKNFDLDINTPQPFSGLNILDIGCGGGLLSEPMSRLGAKVSGIDACEESIQIATWHAKELGLDIDYELATIEEYAVQKKLFDIVLNMEVIEHVAHPEEFIHNLSQVLKPGGIMILSTINRTWQSYAQAIIGAEYILRWLPHGTHDWKKFLTPAEIAGLLRKHNMILDDIKGIKLSLCSREWLLSDDTAVNYVITAKRG